MSLTNLRPQPTTFAELRNVVNEIVTWTMAHPVDDYVIRLPLPYGAPPTLQSLKPLGNIDAYVAGSNALHRYLTHMNETGQLKWKASDADIFFLNQVVNNRLPVDSIDIVQCKEKTVEELLINFDLPICRVAYNFAYDFWISAQCVAAIHTRKQNCPSYLRDKITFTRLLQLAKSSDGVKRDDVATNATKNGMLYSRFVDRVTKYQNRGYGINWIDTNKIIPWVINRFHYAEWLMTELPIADKVDTHVNTNNVTKDEKPKEIVCDCCKQIRKILLTNS